MESSPGSRLVSVPAVIVLVLLVSVGYVFLMPKVSRDEDFGEKDARYEKISDAFLSGNWQEGKALLEKTEGEGYKKWQQERLQKLIDRVDRALTSADQARKLMMMGQRVQGAQLMAQASREYPESREMRSAADYYEGQVALDTRDYALYLKLAEQNFTRDPHNPDTVLWLANALALQYGATGDASYRERALGTLADGQSQNLEARKRGFLAEADAIRERLKPGAAGGPPGR
jgi:hypothetical protein